ncbi:DUF3303 domain-containing protein [Pseudomonas sp. R5(2019)]|uniref:DUF3303 domain-containing protein n=1 Tax=Pseudomonas sp. R5(2019) TaxID=2697566 RepID=UPI001411F28C|nr:DUF3303 family protein [Pseudomonas sp. R5(2019)]NBA97370.1 DUF3303 domain-containing protein [Pseudomonas sp. R5(2019)]
MLFIVKWRACPASRDAAIERFVRTGGLPPEGVKMIGRWHAVGSGMGFGVAEADDVTPVQRWALQWNDLLEMEVYPAMTDEQAGPLMAAAVGR